MAEAGLGADPGFAQKPCAGAYPPACPGSGSRHESFAAIAVRGLHAVAQRGVTPLKKQEPSCLLKTNSNFP